MEFKDILLEIMKEENLNQVILSKKIGISQSMVSEWLSGKTKPSYDNLRIICQKLEISGDRILGLANV